MATVRQGGVGKTADVIGKWLLSESGRKAAAATVGIIGACTFTGFVLPHSLLINKYRDFLHMYRFGLPVPLDPDVSARARSVAETIASDKKIDFFTINGVDIYQIGSLTLNRGILIGLPSTFSYKSEKDVDKSSLKVSLTSPDWESAAGRTLLSSLVLSESAQRFAIARECYQGDSYQPYIRGGFSSLVVFGCYNLASGINHRSKLYDKSRSMRMILYSLVLVFGIVLMFFAIDASTNHLELRADRLACDLGVEWARSGVEFYDKILSRNIALRTLIKTGGDKRFTAKGNDVVLFRTPHVPYTQRLEYVKARVKQYEEDSFAS